MVVIVFPMLTASVFFHDLLTFASCTGIEHCNHSQHCCYCPVKESASDNAHFALTTGVGRIA